VFVEFLDGKRYEDSVYFSQLFHIFEMKYKKGMFDLVILSDNLALDFSLKYGKSLFGDVPVVYCGVKNLESYNLANLPYYGVLETEQDEIVLRQIITLFPDLKNMYLISDKTQSGITDMARVMNITKKLPSSIQYHFIDDIYLDTLLAQAHTFKTTDAVFLISLQRDKYGHALNYGRVSSVQLLPHPYFVAISQILAKV